jgi:hypothetical protein
MDLTVAAGRGILKSWSGWHTPKLNLCIATLLSRVVPIVNNILQSDAEENEYLNKEFVQIEKDIDDCATRCHNIKQQRNIQKNQNVYNEVTDILACFYCNHTVGVGRFNLFVSTSASRILQGNVSSLVCEAC